MTTPVIHAPDPLVFAADTAASKLFDATVGLIADDIEEGNHAKQ